MTTDSPIIIACAATGAFALPLAVTLRSAMENLDPKMSAEIYVVDDGLSIEDRRKVENSLPPRAQLFWIERPVSEIEGLPHWGKMSLTTYRRLTLGEWLPPHARRAIWLDVDLLVLRDLRELWNSDLADNVVLAAQDRGIAHLSGRFGVAAYRELGLAPDAKYFNAGVLLIDIERWRREEVMQRAYDYLRRYRFQIFFWEQEALNVVLAGRWREIDPRWNRIPRLDFLVGGETPNQTAAAPWIIHYAGNLKPWIYRAAISEHDRYFAIVDLTEWRGWRPKQNWRTHLLGKYQFSRLRKMLFPLEQIHLRLVRWKTRR